MAFVEKKWDLSDEVFEEPPAIEYKNITPGQHDLIIRKAELTSDKVYIITLEDLGDPDSENPASSQFRYWLNTTDSTGKVVKNVMARGTLITLGEALAGKSIGIPEPSSIIGGVVHADVTLSKPNANGQSYLRIYKFEPVSEDLAACAEIDQYYIGATVE